MAFKMKGFSAFDMLGQITANNPRNMGLSSILSSRRNMGMYSAFGKHTDEHVEDEKKKDDRTDAEKTADWNRRNAKKVGTTATYNPKTGTYVSDKTQKEMDADHYAKFKANVLKNNPNMTEKQIKQAYAARKKS